MRKLLLIILMSAVGISFSMAQTVRMGANSNKNAAPTKPMMHQSLTTKSMKDVKTQIATVSPLVMNQDVKIISTISKGGKTIQLVQNANGSFSKRLVLNNTAQKLNRKTVAPISKSTTAATLFESFEDWDGEEDWTPAGWSRDNKTDITTWTMSSGGFIANPTDGDYMAWVDLGFLFDEDNEYIGTTDPRDEMLISPAFTPTAGDILFFDVSFAALWMFLDYSIFDFTFDDPVYNVEVLISDDDGANWNVIYSIAEDETLFDYEALFDYEYMENEWYSIKLPMEDYIGKSIKIAFRYTDRDGGDNVGLDNIEVCPLQPEALYMRPQGYFKAGLLQDWRGLTTDWMLGHAYATSIWRNLSIDAESYSWEFENPDGSGTYITTTDINPDIPYPYNGYDVPILTAVGGGVSSEFQWGTPGGSYFQAGGNLDMGEGLGFVGSGNYDLSYDFYTYIDGEGGYAFGTKVDNSIEGVANYFEKPVHKYILEGVWAALTRFSFPAETEFTMVIHRVVDGKVDDDDIIATATCTPADVTQIGATAFTMPFANFITIDPETGLEVENDYIEIEDAILIEIKGFNDIPGSEICFLAQEFNSDPTGESNAYIYVKDPDRRLVHYNGNSSLAFNLELTYSFLVADSYQFDAPDAGGEKTFDIISYYSPDGWWYEEDLPEWLSDDLTFDPSTWEIQYTLIADPLPSELTYREAVVKVVTFGADMSILVKQGISTSLPAVVTASDAKVVKRNDSFDLTYSLDYTAVSVYNVAGQQVAVYQLPTSGTFSIPAGNYSKGVYLISFTGSKGVSTVKVMK